jgi:hypothetical protein
MSMSMGNVNAVSWFHLASVGEGPRATHDNFRSNTAATSDGRIVAGYWLWDHGLGNIGVGAFLTLRVYFSRHVIIGRAGDDG